jgi:hypothetical protein
VSGASPTMIFRTLHVRLLATLRPSTGDHYRHTVRLFMVYLRQGAPEIRCASELKRDPDIYCGCAGFSNS